EWEKAAALGRSIDPSNSIYGSGAAAAPAAEASAPAAAAAPTLDFDLGGASQGSPAAPDISFDEPPKDPTSTSLDLELGSTQTLKLDTKAPDKTVASSTAEPSIGGLDFNLDLGAPEEKKAEPAAEAPAAAAPNLDAGLDFNLDLDDKKDDAPPPPGSAAAPVDLGDISLDLGAPGEEALAASSGSSDPKWQEVATKLDLAKAYEEIGDKDGTRELLNEVMKDGDSGQKGQAEQILAKLG